jgi:O-antigen ligase
MNAEANLQRRSMALSKWGLLLFLTGFFWSPSNDVLIIFYHLMFFFPFLALAPWKHLDACNWGGMHTVVALAWATYSTVSSLWGNAGDIWFFFWQFVVLATWLLGSAWIIARHKPDLANLYRMILAVALVSGLITILMFYLGNPWHERLVGWNMAKNPVLIAQSYGAVALLSWVLSLQASNWKHSFVYLVVTAGLMLPVLLSQSRWPLLAFVLMAFVMFCVVRPRKEILRVHVPVYLMLGVVIAFMDVTAFLANRGFSYRIDIWREVWQLARETPLFGSGYKIEDHIPMVVGDFHHPHNAWLDIFYRTGLVGLALALAHLTGLLRCFSRHKDQLPLFAWLGFGCICLLTDSRVLFWEINSKWFLYWIPAGLIAALVTTRGSETPKS